MIEVKNLSKEYDNPVLEDLNFTIPDGAIFGLIGVNGAGKTTLLNMLSGVMEQDFGQILYDNEPIFENVNRKKEIFYLPDDPFFTVATTPKNLISIYKVFYKIDVKKYYEYLKEFNLDKNKSMFNFSKGMKRQVFVALALAIKPRYLFLDESFDGLDPMARMIFKREIVKIQETQETTVVISSHSLKELSDICDSYGIINHKKILSFGDVDTLLGKYHRYTMGFDKPMKQSDFDIDFVQFQADGRIIHCVTKHDFSTMKEMIEDMNPIILEEIALDFEEQFMIEIELKKGEKND